MKIQQGNIPGPEALNTAISNSEQQAVPVSDWAHNAGRNLACEAHIDKISIGMDVTEDEVEKQLEECKDWEESQSGMRGFDLNSGGERDADNWKPANGSSFFDDARKSVPKALLLFYINSGLMRFQRHREYMNKWTGCVVDKQRLVSEIWSEASSEQEIQEMIKRFLCNHLFTEGRLMACGCCGRRSIERECGPLC